MACGCFAGLCWRIDDTPDTPFMGFPRPIPTIQIYIKMALTRASFHSCNVLSAVRSMVLEVSQALVSVYLRDIVPFVNVVVKCPIDILLFR